MKEFANNGSFKDRIKNKLDDSPVYKNHEEELWSKVIHDIEENETKEEKIKVIKIHPAIWYATAASLVLGLFVSILYWNNKQTATHIVANQTGPIKKDLNIVDSMKVNDEVIHAPIDEKSPSKSGENNNIPSPDLTPTLIASEEKVLEYDLPDKSHLTLNKSASVKLIDNFKNKRSLSMQGEAYFEIEPDKSRPFTIYFDNHHLLVVGTKFNVRNMKDEKFKEISVTEGIVRIFPNNKGQGIEVKAGEQLKIYQEGKTELASINPYNFIFWKLGVLDFKNSTMEEVAVLMSRQYNQKINIAKSISKCTFTGDFTQLSLDEAIHILKITTSYKIEKSKDEIYISGEGCK